MNKRILGLISCFLLGTLTSHAGFMVEPLVGYHMGKAEYKYLDTMGGTSDSGTINGIRYGLGLGYRFPFKMLLGVDYTMSTLDTKFDNATSTDAVKWNQTAYYLTIGYQATPEGRVGIGVGNFESNESGTTKTKFTGTTLKASAGYEFKKNISLNVEYILYTLAELTPEGQSALKSADIFSKFNYSATVMTFSFPFEFGK